MLATVASVNHSYTDLYGEHQDGVKLQFVSAGNLQDEDDGELQNGLQDGDICERSHLFARNQNRVVRDAQHHHHRGHYRKMVHPQSCPETVGRDGHFVVQKP